MALAVVIGPGLVWAGDKGQQTASQHHLINQQRMQELRERIADLRERVKQHRHSSSSTTNTSLDALQAKVASLESSIAALLTADTTLLANLQAAQTQIQTMQLQITALQSQPAGSGGGVPGLEKYLFIETADKNNLKGPHLVFRGVNVHVQSGSGATVDTTTGLGNLIIGYNEIRTDGVGVNRTGSHNLVGGAMNSFSSSGGLVFGTTNTISGRYAAILSGDQNVASGLTSAILGGGLNTASGQSSTVFGGFSSTGLNAASGPYSIKPDIQPPGN
ncbi:MAG: hypothetical protein ACT4O4_11640 [Nitrospiraceae bacterium]